MVPTDGRAATLSVDGELVAGRQALQVPIAVRTDSDADGGVLEVEAQQAATNNRTVRLTGLSARQVRRLRDDLDQLLGTIE